MRVSTWSPTTVSRADGLLLGARLLGAAASAVPVFVWPTLAAGYTPPMAKMMMALSAAGVVVSLFGWAPAMSAVALATFLPVGLYMLGARNQAVLIGLSPLALLLAAWLVHSARGSRSPAA